MRSSDKVKDIFLHNRKARLQKYIEENIIHFSILAQWEVSFSIDIGRKKS